MKQFISASFWVAAVLAAGCVSRQHGLVLDSIGPPDLQPAGAGSNGTLVVFSAFDSHADFSDLPYRRHYTDYKITRKDGKVVQVVRNDTGTLPECPKRVQLPVGAYRVAARANGYGLVTVPVVIRSDQTTTVHLEGGSSWQNREQLSQPNPVRLPDGEIAGWRASSDDSRK